MITLALSPNTRHVPSKHSGAARPRDRLRLVTNRRRSQRTRPPAPPPLKLTDLAPLPPSLSAIIIRSCVERMTGSRAQPAPDHAPPLGDGSEVFGLPVDVRAPALADALADLLFSDLQHSAQEAP